MNKKYAIFVASNINYLCYLNALLNSLDKQGIENTVYILSDNLPEQYLKDIVNRMSYEAIPVNIRYKDFDINKYNDQHGRGTFFIKRARFKYVSDFAPEYDAVCLLDADMFVVSRNFSNFFELVSGTNLLVGCNERFKWNFPNRYRFKGEPIFKDNIKDFKFHCSVPIFFDFKKWEEVFKTYNEMCFNSFEYNEKNEIIKSTGDIFCWNIAVCKNQREDDVILFPMGTMTQVHHTHVLPCNHINRVSDSLWVNEENLEVFSIHGRVDKRGYKEQSLRAVTAQTQGCITDDTTLIRHLKKAERIIKEIRTEWVSLNKDYKVKLNDYIKYDLGIEK